MNFGDRKFKLWFYQVSHCEAIIRSPKTDLDKKYETNIDLYLGDIMYMEVPWILYGLQIGEATEEDAAYLTQRLGKEIPLKKIIVLLSEGRRFYVVASIIKVLENDLDYSMVPICAFITSHEERPC